MADIREVFTIIEDGTGAGVSLPNKVEGDAPGSGINTLAFRDSAGNLTRPQLTASGALPVDSGGVAGTPASASAVVTIAALSTEEDVVALTLGTTENINCSMAMGSSFQPCVWVLYHDDNASLNEIARFVTGPGDFAHSVAMDNITFTTGAAGAQRMVLRCTQIRGPLSDAHGTISLLNLG